jgi:hypothetical protein
MPARVVAYSRVETEQTYAQETKTSTSPCNARSCLLVVTLLALLAGAVALTSETDTTKTTKTCAAGQTRTRSDAPCQACENGKQPNSDAKACVTCPENFAGQSGICEECHFGYTPAAHQSICRPVCVNGTFHDPAVDQCSQCPDGKQAHNETDTECQNCTGTFAGLGGFCLNCTAEETPIEDHTLCSCPDHAIAVDSAAIESHGAGTCNSCGDGQQPNDDQNACEICPTAYAGTNGTCDQCPSAQEPNTERTDCTDCGYWLAAVSGTCWGCPAGKEAKSPAIDCGQVTVGVWRGCYDCLSGYERLDGNAEACCVAGGA